MMQIFVLLLLRVSRPELFGTRFALLAVIGLPTALGGTLPGIWIYRTLSDASFREAALALLAPSGSSLIVKSCLP